jgi:dipeptidyl aminopeptidase/acylaminoacyl peptidase
MRSAPLARAVVLCVGAALLPRGGQAQGTAADYQRADGLRDRLEGLVVDAAETPTWVGTGSSQLVYRKSVKGGYAFVLVDAATLRKGPAFDHDRLAAAFVAARDTTKPRPAAPARATTGVTLPFARFTFVDGSRAIEFTAGGRPGETVTDSARWRCTITDYVCSRAPAPAEPQFRGGLSRGEGGGLFGERRAPPPRPRVSPDGKWEAFVRNYNVAVRPTDGGQVLVLGTDGTEGEPYDQQSIVWSPDSKRLAAWRVKPGYRREVHYVESSPEDQLQPKHSTFLYNKPGDVLDQGTAAIFDVGARSEIVVDRALYPNQYTVSGLEWRKDSRAVTFEYNQRGHQVYRVVEIDPATGKTRALVSEEPKTFFEYSAKKFRADLADGREIVWMSERDGWNHLYLYDGVTGKVKSQITKGPWVVRGVDWVDSTKRQIWFTASGMYPGKDPYFVHAYRINFDGTGLTPLTEADANHTVVYSPDHAYYADLYSRVDLPPVLELRRASDHAVIAALEKADASALLAIGWRPPEVFVSKGRDGTTDIWGVIVRPMGFDPARDGAGARKYPVIENIYAGPQGAFVPKTFSTQLGMQAQAELGFVVAQVDGMGTSNRSKAFHDVAWRNLGDAGFPDRILWHKAVAARYPYYDVTRVGIYGTSAGGQNAMGALLFHPEFYKAAVSAAGCHDNRMDKIWWNEQWMGELGPHYEASSNVVNAGRLQGKLLLVVGEMDMNVDPSSTFQVVNALIKANKQFDLLVIPGAGHTNGGPYGERKRFDFFVHHLLGVEPPERNGRVAAAATDAGPGAER